MNPLGRQLLDAAWLIAVVVMLGFCVIVFVAVALAALVLWAKVGL